MAKPTEIKRYFVNAFGIGTTLTPLVHTEASVGNKTFVRRLSIKSGDQIISTPAISGNSFRGMWRDLAAIDLMQQLQTKELLRELFGVFFSGGLLTKEIKKGLGDKLYATFPALRLLGFSFGNIMFPSKVGTDFAVPITTDTLAYGQAVYPQLDCPKPTLETSEITAMTMLTAKKDDEKAALIELHLTATKDQERSGQMIYHVEYIVPNINFVHGFRSLYPLGELEFGALLKVLSLSSGRSFGGLASKGFGRMNWTYTLQVADAPNAKGKSYTVQLGNTLAIDADLQPILAAYDEYIRDLPDKIKKDPDLKTMIK
jgi:hypothetical protein